MWECPVDDSFGTPEVTQLRLLFCFVQLCPPHPEDVGLQVSPIARLYQGGLQANTLQGPGE